jgi:hypothetical protein
MRYIIFSILFIAVSLSTPLSAQQEEPAQKAILITGASTGIGRSMAELMAYMDGDREPGADPMAKHPSAGRRSL